ncbi:hypothetical protein CHE218_28510 [Microbacterium sp. che218]
MVRGPSFGPAAAPESGDTVSMPELQAVTAARARTAMAAPTIRVALVRTVFFVIRVPYLH